LALAPGRREFGIAVFNGAELMFFALREFKRRQSERLLKRKIARIVSELIEMYAPSAIAVKAISEYQSRSDVLHPFVRMIKRNARKRNIPYKEVSIHEIRSKLCRGERPTLKQSFHALTVIYPDISPFWNRSTKWQVDYYHNLFLAVAAGFVCLNDSIKELTWQANNTSNEQRPNPSQKGFRKNDRCGPLS
jgi:hypothetical protein